MITLITSPTIRWQKMVKDVFFIIQWLFRTSIIILTVFNVTFFGVFINNLELFQVHLIFHLFIYYTRIFLFLLLLYNYSFE